MNRLSMAIAPAILGLLLMSVDGNAQDGSRSPTKSIANDNGGLFSPGQPIPVARTRRLGQIGRDKSYRSIVMGTADVYGHGPYDLFLSPNRLFPFRGFHEDGTPYYGQPIKTKGQAMNGVVLTGPDGVIYGIFASGKRVRVCILDRAKQAFQQVALSNKLDLPGSIGGGMAAHIDAEGKLHVYFSIADGTSYRPPGDHHAATYLPFDGAGFWRGGIPRRKLFHARFDKPKLGKTEIVNRIGRGPGEFLFSLGGMTVVKLGENRPPALVTSEKLGVMRYFAMDPSTEKLAARQFVNNEELVALRHPVINANLKAIPDPKTGLSNLVVGDTGRIWFYRFTGRFAENGSPIYGSPRPVQAEAVHLTLGALPVISPGDVDGDGLIDLIAGNDAGQLLFVKNIGDPRRPEFDEPAPVSVGGRPLDIKAGYRGSIQGPGEAMWGYTCPTLHDWNGDGRLDVILNSIMADYMLLLQQPSDAGPVFTEPKRIYCDGLQLHLAWRSQPAITDWGTGGRLSMIVLDERNLLRRYWRIDNQNVERGELLRLHDGSPIAANVDEGAGQTGRAKLVAHDWDGDGDIDLLIGASRGLSFPASKSTCLPSYYQSNRKASVLLLRNIGSNSKPVFDYVKQLDFNGKRIGLGIHSCSPAPVDLGRGVVDLLVGEENGSIHYYPRESLSVSSPVR
ncbi:MAG: VCBS repeat-containing protein [Planctomycetota bacterium]|nr:VCBS repeat-containing protein [Planctomycetota bacterium]